MASSASGNYLCCNCIMFRESTSSIIQNASEKALMLSRPTSTEPSLVSAAPESNFKFFGR